MSSSNKRVLYIVSLVLYQSMEGQTCEVASAFQFQINLLWARKPFQETIIHC